MLLAGRLAQLIDVHSEAIANKLAARIKKRPQLSTLARLPAAELAEWCRDMLRNLSSALRDTPENMERRCRLYGCARFEESTPLQEAVLRLFLLKDTVLDFVHDEAMSMTAVDLYAEEELFHRVSRFFDSAIYHVVCGYEDAMRGAVQQTSRL
jgi:hypothetical protein